jgi:decaprenylphospho-beta-D-erythro-pentofuranosid-2-ulose 2-reductase
MNERIVVFGATRGMGRALARAYAGRGASLVILGRNEAELARSAADLQARGARECSFERCDLENARHFAPALDAAFSRLGHVDVVAVTAGLFATQDELEEDLSLASRVLQADFTQTVIFCEEAKRRLLGQRGGTLVVFSSVAGERGRRPVVLYGAAKAGLSRYLEGLDHKHRADGLRVLTVKPGFVRTSMTEGLDPPPFAGEPADVARDVIRAIERGASVVYTPWPWRYVMGVIRALPRAVMRRVKF